MSVIVVDNGSTDNSISEICAAHPEVLLLRSQTNLGFAGGNNIGIRHALAHGADYVWLLNNDTEPAPSALSELVAKAMTNAKIGAVASVCYYFDAPSKVQVWAGTRVNLWIGYTRNSTVPRIDDWFEALYGASLLSKREAIEEVGLLDDGFFLLWEETEFCLRLRYAGWLLAAAPNSSVLHKVGSSTGGNKLITDRYFTTSGLRILRLHSPFPYLSMALFLAMRIARRVFTLQLSRCVRVLEGIQDYCNSPPKVRERNRV
jgi:hypothetical protein